VDIFVHSEYNVLTHTALTHTALTYEHVILYAAPTEAYHLHLIEGAAVRGKALWPPTSKTYQTGSTNPRPLSYRADVGKYFRGKPYYPFSQSRWRAEFLITNDPNACVEFTFNRLIARCLCICGVPISRSPRVYPTIWLRTMGLGPS
jgi:hypothetical protein